MLKYVQDNFQVCFGTFSGSILVLLGILVFIATYRKTRHIWVLMITTLFIICNIAYVAQWWLMVPKNLKFRMAMIFISWDSFLMYHWLFALKYLKCSLKIPIEVENKILHPSTPRLLQGMNVLICMVIQACTYYEVSITFSRTATKQERDQATLVFMIPYFVISVVCCIALYKIRSFFRALGLGHRIDTGKIVFHVAIFLFFSFELIAQYAVKKIEQKKVLDVMNHVFTASLIAADLAILWILYSLGTKQIDDTSRDGSVSQDLERTRTDSLYQSVELRVNETFDDDN